MFENGAFFDVLLESIGRAEHSVHFETFLWKEGTLGQRVADALTAQARAGRQVRVLLDATGSAAAGKDAVQQMRDAGCKVKFFHKRKLLNVGVLNDRDHRKIVIVDGREAFVGGHCIVDDWLGNAEDGKHYADVSVRLRGPIVHSVQSAFSENWGGETGELFVGNEVFPKLEPAGDAVIHAVFVKPQGSAPGGEDPAPHGDLPGAQAHLDPEPLLHPGAGGDRRLRRGRQARRGRARDDALHQRLGQPDGAARGAPQFREDAQVRRAPLRVPAHAAAPEGDDGGRCLERASAPATSTTAPSRPTTRSRWRSRTPAAGRGSWTRSSRNTWRAARRSSWRSGASAGVWHKLKDNTVYVINELL